MHGSEAAHSLGKRGGIPLGTSSLSAECCQVEFSASGLSFI